MPTNSAQTDKFEQLRAVFVDVFHVDPTDVTAETQFGELPPWDSMGHMDLMVSLETQFGVPITAETISNLTSIPAILAYLESNSNG
jgi:acyl carrier protein